jgi:hypothetical protein
VDIGLLDDPPVSLKFTLDASVELRRRRRNGVDAAGGEALFDVRGIEQLGDRGIELVDDRPRRGLGREQRGPVRGVDLGDALLLQGRPPRTFAIAPTPLLVATVARIQCRSGRR